MGFGVSGRCSEVPVLQRFVAKSVSEEWSKFHHERPRSKIESPFHSASVESAHTFVDACAMRRQPRMVLIARSREEVVGSFQGNLTIFTSALIAASCKVSSSSTDRKEEELTGAREGSQSLKRSNLHSALIAASCKCLLLRLIEKKKN